MDGLEIIIDDREKAVIPHFNTLDKALPFKVERLTVGDYAILYRKCILFTIERKTWTDLSASIKDLRSKNVQNLIDLREKTGCHIIYMIEGNPLPKHKTKYARIPYKNLRSHLDHLAFRDNVHIMHSKDEKDTAYRINEIAKNYTTIVPSPLKKFDDRLDVVAKEKPETKEKDTPEQISEACSVKIIDDTPKKNNKKYKKKKEKTPTEGGNEIPNPIQNDVSATINTPETQLQNQVDTSNTNSNINSNNTDNKINSQDEINAQDETHLLKIKKTITPNVILYRLWCSLPGITTATASLLVDKYPIIDYILGRVPVSEIAILRYPSGMIIGEDRAKKMLRISNTNDSNNKPFYIKLMEQIPLISKGTAIKLLKTFGIKEILEGKVPKEKIAEIPRSAKKRIGAKAVSNMFMYLGIKPCKA